MGLVVICALGLSACSSGRTVPAITQAAKGTIRGFLLSEPGGGAAPGAMPRPMAGTVLIEFNNLDALVAMIVTVGTSGRFSRFVAPGTCTVVPGRKTGCISAPITVHVRPGRVVTVKVKCRSSIG
jgi:hypothetical protein